MAARPAPGRPRVAGSRRPRPSVGVGQSAPDQPAQDLRPHGSGHLVVVGRIGRPQGLRGEVTVEVRTDDPDARFADGAVLLTDPPERGPLVVESSRDHSGRLVVSFVGVPDRSAAEVLRDTFVQVDAATVPDPVDPDVFHDWQLEGLLARLEDGTELGRVAEVLHLPGGDVLAVRPATGPEVLVPFVKAIVPVVDVAGGFVVLTPPDGLLDLSEG